MDKFLLNIVSLKRNKFLKKLILFILQFIDKLPYAKKLILGKMHEKRKKFQEIAGNLLGIPVTRFRRDAEVGFYKLFKYSQFSVI